MIWTEATSACHGALCSVPLDHCFSHVLLASQLFVMHDTARTCCARLQRAVQLYQCAKRSPVLHSRAAHLLPQDNLQMQQENNVRDQRFLPLQVVQPNSSNATQGASWGSCIQGVSPGRQAGFSKIDFFLGFFVKFWFEFCKCCFWVFRLIGGFLSTSPKHRTVLKICHVENETTLVQNITTIVGACCLLNFSCSACVREGAGPLKSSRKYVPLTQGNGLNPNHDREWRLRLNVPQQRKPHHVET